jgi:predicted amidohydrolase
MSWTAAACQFDCQLGDPAANLATIARLLHAAADRGANLIVFPEMALAGYGFADRAACAPFAESIPGPATAFVAELCRQRQAHAVFGLIERAGDKLFNAAAVVGPGGLVGSYRKVHLPCVGADWFLDPGDRPFEVFDLVGLRIGVNICFDGSFPESIRSLALLGADAVVLPTNWSLQAHRMATLVTRVRALENHVDFVACNRVGVEAGFTYLGQSSITSFTGDFLAFADTADEAIITASLDPVGARQKKVVIDAGTYELDRMNWRRPEFYEVLQQRFAHSA